MHNGQKSEAQQKSFMATWREASAAAACVTAFIDSNGISGGGADPSVSPGLLSGTGVCSKLLYRLCELATGVPPLLEEAPAEPDLTVASEIAFIQSCRSLAVCAANCVLHKQIARHEPMRYQSEDTHAVTANFDKCHRQCTCVVSLLAGAC